MAEARQCPKWIPGLGVCVCARIKQTLSGTLEMIQFRSGSYQISFPAPYQVYLGPTMAPGSASPSAQIPGKRVL